MGPTGEGDEEAARAVFIPFGQRALKGQGDGVYQLLLQQALRSNPVR